MRTQAGREWEMNPQQRSVEEPGRICLETLRKRAANEPGRLAVTDEAALRLLAVAGRGGTY